jgi:hypothetical protein
MELTAEGGCCHKIKCGYFRKGKELTERRALK